MDMQAQHVPRKEEQQQSAQPSQQSLRDSKERDQNMQKQPAKPHQSVNKLHQVQKAHDKPDHQDESEQHNHQLQENLEVQRDKSDSHLHRELQSKQIVQPRKPNDSPYRQEDSIPPAQHEGNIQKFAKNQKTLGNRGKGEIVQRQQEQMDPEKKRIQKRKQAQHNALDMQSTTVRDAESNEQGQQAQRNTEIKKKKKKEKEKPLAGQSDRQAQKDVQDDRTGLHQQEQQKEEHADAQQGHNTDMHLNEERNNEDDQQEPKQCQQESQGSVLDDHSQESQQIVDKERKQEPHLDNEGQNPEESIEPNWESQSKPHELQPQRRSKRRSQPPQRLQIEQPIEKRPRASRNKQSADKGKTLAKTQRKKAPNKVDDDTKDMHVNNDQTTCEPVHPMTYPAYNHLYAHLYPPPPPCYPPPPFALFGPPTAYISAPNQAPQQINPSFLPPPPLRSNSNSAMVPSAPSNFASSSAAAAPAPPPSPTPPPPPSSQPARAFQDPHAVNLRPMSRREALDYIQSVKTAFASQPDVFNRFLSLLKANSNKSMSVSAVITEVSQLLSGRPDLLEGFNGFLPPSYRIRVPKGKQQAGVPPPPSAQGQAEVSFANAISFVTKLRVQFWDKPQVPIEFERTLEAVLQKRMSRSQAYEKMEKVFGGDISLLNEFSQFMPDDDDEDVVMGESTTTVSVLGRRGTHTREAFEEQCAKRLKRLNSIGPEALEAAAMAGADPAQFANMPTTGSETDQLFERIQRVCGNPITYHSFLKLVNAFNQNIIDMATMMERAKYFIGRDKQLFDDFKAVLSYSDPYPEPAPLESNVRNADFPESRVRGGESPRRVHPITAAERNDPGPSYRMVSKSESSQCSGADALCRQVFNDKYVSHPTWASEDGGFVASKKNQFEEVLHRIEEERYARDLDIDSGVATIALLERIVETVEGLPPEERQNYRAPPRLGARSETVYKRALSKIYDRCKYNDIISLLHANPAQSAKPVLKRLKAKVEDWKTEFNNLNEVWKKKENDAYFKALDYRSMTFKNIDKKILSDKALVSEIEALARDQLDIDMNSMENNAQIKFYFSDRAVFEDINGLLLAFMKHRTIYKSDVLGSIRSVMEKFVMPLLDPSPEVPEDGEHHENDGSELANPPICDALIANDAIFCFFRLYQILYERLKTMKDVADDYASNLRMTKDFLQAKLDIDAKEAIVNDIRLDFSKGYYQTLLDLADCYIGNKIDSSAFEECSRYIFGLKSYVISTIDKILYALCHQAYVISTDERCQGLIELYMKDDHTIAQTDINQLQAYQLQAEAFIKGNENMYRLLFADGPNNSKHRSLFYSLLARDDDQDYSRQAREYQESFASWQLTTVGVNREAMRPSFLQRNLRTTWRDRARVMKAQAGHGYKICSNTYHLFYITDSEDYLRLGTSRRLSSGRKKYKLKISPVNQ